ncbi:hypothetical protein V7457_27215 [Bacillus toyonensis]|uniref:hypothetical protein n=1 Tax=Bacillus toyonensis TaxID=155322 RepID=UPI002FFE94E4
MNKIVPLGPSADQEWKEIKLDSPQHMSLLVLPDAVNSPLQKGGIYYYLPQYPQLNTNINNEPVLSLTLVLKRETASIDENIMPLIKQGMFSFEVNLNNNIKPFEMNTSTGLSQYRPLNPSEILFELVSLQEDTEKLLASENVGGVSTKAGINIMLNSTEAVDVLSALNGTPSKILIRTKVSYKVAPRQKKISLSGSWEKVYNVLKTQAEVSSRFTIDILRNCFYEMITKGILAVNVNLSSDDLELEQLELEQFIKNHLFDTFLKLSTVILEKVTSEDESDEGPKYVLRNQPDAMLELIYEQTISVPTPTDKSITITEPLDAVIGGVLNDLDRNKFIHAIASM